MGFSITGFDANLGEEPFFRIRLDEPGLIRLNKELLSCQARPREWFTLAATHDNPARLRLLKSPTPEFEGRAAPLYIRGEILRISGSHHRSCNITFSSIGAKSLAEGLVQARRRMRRFIELRIESRRHGLVELIPDADLPAALDADTLSLSLESAAAQSLPREDFSDWER